MKQAQNKFFMSDLMFAVSIIVIAIAAAIPACLARQAGILSIRSID